MGIFLRNKSWYISYFNKGRRIREKVGSSKTLANKALKKRETEIAEGKFLDIKNQKRVRLKELTSDYKQLYASSKKSFNSHYTVALNCIEHFFSNPWLDEITVKRVEDYKVHLTREGLAQASVNRRLACLKNMFNKAIDWHMTEQNPVRKVKLFKENNQRTRHLDKEELERVLEKAPPRLQAIINFAINTGLRKGEIQNLKWKDVDFQQEYIAVHETKNGETRYIPMNNTARNAIFSFKQKGESVYVFSGNDGQPYNFRKSFETAIKNADIRDFRFHDLRHTFASNLAMKGVDLNTIRELMGHKSLEMTLRYSHLSKDHKTRAVALLNEHVPKVSLSERLTNQPELVESTTLLAEAS